MLVLLLPLCTTEIVALSIKTPLGLNPLAHPVGLELADVGLHTPLVAVVVDDWEVLRPKMTICCFDVFGFGHSSSMPHSLTSNPMLLAIMTCTPGAERSQPPGTVGLSLPFVTRFRAIVTWLVLALGLIAEFSVPPMTTLPGVSVPLKFSG